MKTKLQLLVITLLFASNVFSQLGTGCWREISAGANNFCLAIKMDGTLWGWGQNGNLLGLNGNMTNQNLPIQIGTANDWMTVSAGASHSLAVKTNGTLWGWGNGSFGQLGNGNTISTWTLTQVGTATDWLKVSAGSGFSLAIKNTGTLWSFGINSTGQLGINSVINQGLPTQIGTASNWDKIEAGAQHSLAIDTTGLLYSWGDNTFGQLGDGTNTTSLIPIVIGTASTWSRISAGLDHSMALDANGLLYTCGNNNTGQLCDGSNTTNNVFTPIINSDGSINFYIEISAGSSFSLAIKNDSTLWSSGYNLFMQLAHGNIQTNSTILTQIGTSNTWYIISAGNSHTMAMETTTQLWEAGRNWEGQIGIGTNTMSYGILQSVGCPTNLATESISLNKIETTIYPNPTSDYVTVDYTLENSGGVSIKLTNLQGQLVSEQRMDKSTGLQIERIDLTKQPSGMYFLSITSENGTFSGKVIKK